MKERTVRYDAQSAVDHPRIRLIILVLSSLICLSCVSGHGEPYSGDEPAVRDLTIFEGDLSAAVGDGGNLSLFEAEPGGGTSVRSRDRPPRGPLPPFHTCSRRLSPEQTVKALRGEPRAFVILYV